MRNRTSALALAVVLMVLAIWDFATVKARQAPPPRLVNTVTLPGYSGDFDHFAVDRVRHRILLAAEDHATLEVFDLDTGKHLRSVTGFDTPHSILVRKASPTILVTDSGKSMSKLLDADTYAKRATVTLMPGADSSAYDAAENILYIVTGGKDVGMATSELAAVNPDTGEKLRSVSFNDNHVEAMALEKQGDRLFINLAQTNQIAVVERKMMKIVATWKVSPAQQNAMVAFDEPRHRLFVVCRKPGMVVVMNSDTGVVTNALPAPLRADDAMYDSGLRRLYVPGGEGFMSIYDTSDPDHLLLVSRVTTAEGAKTGLLLSDMKKLVLAASPGDTKAVAKVLTYQLP
ncbi:MAG: YncE family protein [Terriglobales bacterium]